MSLVLTPVGLLISVIKRFIPLGVLAVIYIFFHEKANAHYPYLLELLISLTAFAVLRKEIQKEVIDICLTVISLVSFGSFLQWLGRGYKRNTVLFNRFFSSEAAKGLVAQYLPYCHSWTERSTLGKFLITPGSPRENLSLGSPGFWQEFHISFHIEMNRWIITVI